MKKVLRAFIASLLIMIFFIAFCYVFLLYYYRNTFPAFLWINDIYSTGKTIEELNAELMQKYDYEGIKVVDIFGNEMFIKSEDVDLKADYTNDLIKIKEERGGITWYQGIYKKKHLSADRSFSLNEGKLWDILLNWDAFLLADEVEVSIKQDENGYSLYDNASYYPLYEKIATDVYNGMLNGVTDIILDESYYTDIASNYQIHLRDLYKKIDEVQNSDCSLYLAGTKISVPENVLGGFILTASEFENEQALEEDFSYILNGQIIKKSEISENQFKVDNEFIVDTNDNLIISEAKIREYAHDFSENCDTEWFMERYINGLGNEIFINETRNKREPLVDEDQVFSKLENVFLKGEEKSDPDLSLASGVKSYDAGLKLGNTFIEINMEKQELNYYVDLKLSMKMPIVTGNINRRRGTPTGIFNVYNKRYHTYLRGVGYVSYVNYWLGVNKGVGIHDANWRDEFGGEIYKTDGSHGCINCPEEQVSKLWEVVETGTPVVMYY